MRELIRTMTGLDAVMMLVVPPLNAQQPKMKTGRTAGHLVPGHHRRSGAVVFPCDARTGWTPVTPHGRYAD